MNILQNNSGEDMNFQGLRVLCAEDNIINQRLAKQILFKWGVDVDIASDGIEAVELLLKQRYDLILMDIQMPKMNGREVTMMIRDANSEIIDHQVPVIGLTADAFQKTDEEALSCGMNFIIVKPLDQEELAQAIIRLRNDGSIRQNRG